MSAWQGKRIFITGTCGTVGRELLRQLASLDVASICGIDNNESAVFFLQQEHGADRRLAFHLGDIRDPDTVRRRMAGADIVLHTAALKHVHLCEDAPHDAIQTNVLGAQNVIDAAIANRVERAIFTSSDKAVNPTTVMGTSKLLGERLFTAANAHSENDRPVFASTRFGNVLGSRGSVIPLFRRQILNGGPITLTDARMTRFIMSLDDAARLVLDSVFLARGGEVFITKMQALRISDLALVMKQEMASLHGIGTDEIAISEIGARPGEKLFEELISEEEVRRAMELDRYFVVVPPGAMDHPREPEYASLQSTAIEKPYNSRNQAPMTAADLRDYLHAHGLLQETWQPVQSNASIGT